MKKILILFMLISINGIADDKVKQDFPKKILSGEGGRFAIGQISDFRSDQYVIDTKTGRIWKIITLTNEKGVQYETLQRVYYLDDKGIFIDTPPQN